MPNFAEYTWLVVVASLVLIIMAFAIGANDVGNAFATSVGSRCLSMRHALMVCAAMEFVGALALGGNVTNTIAQGIVDLRVFERTPGILMYGMLCSISSATIVCLAATLWELPVSTAHSVVAAVVAFGMVYGGSDAVVWYQRVDYYPYFEGVLPVAVGWVLSPFIAAIVAGLLFMTVRALVLRRPYSLQISYWMLPVLVPVTFFVNIFFILYKDKGMTYSLGLDVADVAWISAVAASGVALLTCILVVPLLKRNVRQHIARRTIYRSKQISEHVHTLIHASNPFQQGNPAHPSYNPSYSDDNPSNSLRHSNGHLHPLTMPSSLGRRHTSESSSTTRVPSPNSIEIFQAAVSVDQTISVRSARALNGTHTGLLALDWQAGHALTVADLAKAGEAAEQQGGMLQQASSDPLSSKPCKHVSFQDAQELDGSNHSSADLVARSWHGPCKAQGDPSSMHRKHNSDSHLSRYDQDHMGMSICRSGVEVDDGLNRLRPTSRSSPFVRVPSVDWHGKHCLDEEAAVPVPGKEGATLNIPPMIVESVGNSVTARTNVNHRSGAASSGTGAFDWDAIEAIAKEQESEAAIICEVDKPDEVSEKQSGTFRSVLAALSSQLLMIGRSRSPTYFATPRQSPSCTESNSWCMQLLWFDVLQRTWIEVRTGRGPGGLSPRTWLGRLVHGFTYAINYDVHELIEQDDTTQHLHSNAEVFDPDTEQTFKLVQVFTASVAAFSHGANDLANTIGPFAAIWAVYTVQRVDENTTSPIWAMALAAVGIVLGLAACGYKIIAVLGVKSVAITPSRGFSIELSTALIIALGSHFGIPLSTTHCQVGGTGGVGLAEGSRGGVNARQFRRFFWAWLGSIVAAAMLSAGLFIQGTSAPTLRISGQVSDLEDTVVSNVMNIYCMLNYTNHQPGPGPTNTTLDFIIRKELQGLTTLDSVTAANSNSNVTFQTTRLAEFDDFFKVAMQLLKGMGQLAAGSMQACLE